MPGRSRSRLRKLLLGLLLGLAALAAGLWLARDTPRRAVERALGQRLGARVHLGALEVAGTRRFVLRDLRVEGWQPLPAVVVERLTVGRLEVTSALDDALAGRYERLGFSGVSARLAPAAPAAEPTEAAQLTVGELRLEPAAVTVLGGGGEAGLSVEATLHSLGSETRGTIRVGSPAVPLGPLLALAGLGEGSPPAAGEITDLVANLELDGGRLTVAAGAENLSLVAQAGSLDLPGLEIEGHLEETGAGGVEAGAREAILRREDRITRLVAPALTAGIEAVDGEPGLYRLRLEPRLPVLAAGEATAEWDAEQRRLTRLDARVEGLELAPLLPELDATVEAEAHGEGDALTYGARVNLRRLASGDGTVLAAAAGTQLVLSGRTSFPLPAVAGPLTAELTLPGMAGGLGGIVLPPAVFPLSARFEGELTDAATTAVRGELRIATAGTGHLTARGTVDLPLRLAAAGTGAAAHPGGRAPSPTLTPAAGEEPRAELAWSWQGARLEAVQGLLEGMDVDLPAGLAATGAVSARGELRGRLAAPTLAGRLSISDLTAAAGRSGGVDAVGGGDGAGEPAWSLAGGTLQGRFRWTAEGLDLREVQGGAELTLPPLPALAVRISTTVHADRSLARGEVEEAVLTSPGLGELRGEGRWGSDPDVAATGTLTASGVDLAVWQEVLAPLPGLQLPTGYAFKGLAGADLDATLRGDGAWRLAGEARLAGAGFTSADGSRVVEGLGSQLDVEVEGAGDGALTAAVGGEAGGLLLLWNTFYGDFSTLRAGIHLTGTVAPAPVAPTAAGIGDPGGSGGGSAPPWELSGRVEIPQGPKVAARLAHTPRARTPAPRAPEIQIPQNAGEAEATAPGPATGLDYSLSLDLPDLAATRERYLASLLAASLGEASLAGSLRARLAGSLGEGGAWTARGELAVGEASFASAEGGVEVAGLSLLLPVDLERLPGPEPTYRGEPRRGELRFTALDLAGVALPATATALEVAADSITLVEPVALPLFGGRLHLQRLTGRRLLAPGRRLETGLRLENLRLERISEELGTLPLEGALNGDLPRVRLAGNALEVEGGGQVAVFGGTVKVGDISGSEILTPYPKLTLSIELEGIDLAQLTHTIDFGEMTGTLRGWVDDLELFRGVPVRFEAMLETVETPGVRRTVDVKAVNNITILGTGASAGFLNRGLQRFFDRYTYQRLGVWMALEKDRLLLHGLEQRGEKELFLRGRLPFPIDVVNAQPGRTVSFQTMLRRLESLDFGAVRTER